MSQENGEREKRYKFRKLKDRVKATNVNVSRKLLAEHEFVDKEREDASLKSTFFGDMLSSECLSDRTLDFANFTREVTPLVQSLPLIIHNLKHIVGLLIKYMNKSANRTMVLRLTVSLAKDVQQELFEYLEGILEAAFGLVDPLNLDLSAEVFRNVGLILSEMVKIIGQKDPNLSLLRPFYVTLLTHKRDFIRRFTAETFSPLFRQLPRKIMTQQLKTLIHRLVSGPECASRSLVEREDIADGIAHLVFNVARNVQQKLHSCGPQALDVVFNSLKLSNTTSLTPESLTERLRVAQHTIRLILGFVNRDTSDTVWELFLSHATDDDFEPRGFLCFLRLLNASVSYKKMSQLPENMPSSIFAGIIVPLVQSEGGSSVWCRDPLASNISLEAAKLVVYLWRVEVKSGRDGSVFVHAILDLVENKIPVSHLGYLIKFTFDTLQDLPLLYSELLLPVVNILESRLLKSSSLKKKDVNDVFRYGSSNHDLLEIFGLISDIIETHGEAGELMPACDKLSETSALARTCQGYLLEQGHSVDIYAASLRSLRLCQSGNSVFESCLVDFVFHASTPVLSTSRSLAVHILCTNAVWDASPQHKKLQKKIVSFFLDRLDDFILDEKPLSAFVELVEGTEFLSEIEKKSLLSNFQETLERNVLNQSPKLRLSSLKLLRYCLPKEPELRLETDDPKEERPICNVLDICIDLCVIQPIFEKEKQRERMYVSLSNLIVHTRIPKVYLRSVASFLVGQFWVPYSPVWPLATKCIENLSSKYFHDPVWGLLWYQTKYLSGISMDSKFASVFDNKQSSINSNDDKFDPPPTELDMVDTEEVEMHGKPNYSLSRQNKTRTFFGSCELQIELVLSPNQIESLDATVRVAEEYERATMTLDAFKETFKALSLIGKRVESKADLFTALFFTFLRDEYYGSSGRVNDLDCPKPDEDENAYLSDLPSDFEPLSVAQKSTAFVSNEKLVCWLNVFAAFTKYKPCRRTEVLRKVFSRLIIKPDYGIQPLCLKCLKQMRLPFLQQHFDPLLDMTDEKKFREAITIFQLKDVDDSYRDDLLQLLARILWARLLKRSKKGSKDTSIMSSRRASIFAVFTGVRDTREIRYLLDIVFRVFPKGLDFTLDVTDPQKTLDMLDLGSIEEGRLLGFVRSQEELIKVLGMLLEAFMPQILTYLFGSLALTFKKAHTNEELLRDDDALPKEEVTEGQRKGTVSHSASFLSNLRVETLKRLKEIFKIFDQYDLSPWTSWFGATINPLVQILPGSVLNQNQPPHLLNFFAVLGKSDVLIKWLLRSCPDLPNIFVECLRIGIEDGRGAGPNIVAVIEDIIDDMQRDEAFGKVVLKPVVPELLETFLQRLRVNTSSQFRGTQDMKVEVRRAQAKRELKIISGIAKFFENLGASEITPEVRKSSEMLIVLLSEFLGSANASSFGSGKGTSLFSVNINPITGGTVTTRGEVVGKKDSRKELLTTIVILAKLARLPWDIEERFSRLLGPYGIDPIYDVETRQELIAVLETIGSNGEVDFGSVSRQVKRLNFWDRKRMDSFDFNSRLKVYEELEKVRIVVEEKPVAGESLSIKQVCPLLHQALFDMYESEYPIRSAANNFIVKTLLSNRRIEVAQELVVRFVSPVICAGLKCKSQGIRKGFLMLLLDVALYGMEVTGEKEALADVRKFLFCDILQLRNLEILENDFFTSIVHVQTYRQSSFLRFLRMELSSGSVVLNEFSVVNCVFPLTVHILVESSKDKDRHMKEEGAYMLGELAKYMTWQTYFSALKYFLKLSETDKMLEKRCLKAACLILDNFHFAGNGIDPLIDSALKRQIIPNLEKNLLVKKASNTERKVIRVGVAVAVVKALKQLSFKEMEARIPRLITTIVEALRSPDRVLRDDARDTLVAVVKELGVNYFAQTVNILCSLLKEGFQQHVRGYTLWFLVKATASMHRLRLYEKRRDLGQTLPDFAKLESEIPEGTSEETKDTENILLNGENEVEEAKDREDTEEKPSTDISIMNKLNIEVCSGDIDSLLPKFMEIIEDELFGELAQQKRADTEYKSRIKGLIEAKSSRALELLEYLASIISFLPSPSIHELLKVFLGKMENSTDLHELRITEEALQRIGVGLSRNPDVRVPHLFVYTHHLIATEYMRKLESRNAKKRKVEENESGKVGLDGVLALEKSAKKESVKIHELTSWVIAESETERRRGEDRVRAGNAYEGIHIVEAVPQMTGRDRFDNKRKRNAQQVQKATKRANMHLVAEHGLVVLLSAQKEGVIVITNEEHRHMLDPFIGLFAVVIKESRASKTTILALRLFKRLIPWALPSLFENVPTVVGGIFGILEKFGFGRGAGGGSGSGISTGLISDSMGTDVAMEAFRTLTTIIRCCDFCKLSNEHLKLIVLLSQHNMTVSGRQQSTLSLIREVVARKFLVPEMYDLMTQLAETLFTSETLSVRDQCTKVLVNFLMKYPLSKKRLKQHLDMILANFDYEQEDGRLSGLELLQAIVKRFPEEVVEEIAQTCFFPLVLRLINDESTKCKTAAAESLKLLLGRLSKVGVDRLSEFVLQWLDVDLSDPSLGEDEKEQKRGMQRAAVQVLGLLVDAEDAKHVTKKKAVVYLEKLVKTLNSFLVQSTVHEDWEEKFLFAEEQFGEGEGWLTAFHTIVSLHKLCVGVKGLGGCANVMTEKSQGMPSIMERLLTPLARFHPHLWVRLSCLRLMGQVFDGIETESVLDRDPDISSLATCEEISDLVKIHCSLLNFVSTDEKLADQAVKNLVWLASVLANNEAAFTDSVKSAVAAKEIDENDTGTASDDEAVQAEKGDVEIVTLKWLVHRLSHTARFKGGKRDDPAFSDLRQVSAFKIFAFVATKLKDDKEKLLMLLSPMLSALIRVSVGTPPKSDHKLRAPSLSQEVQDLLEELVGSIPFTKAYAAVHDRIESIKEGRKRALAVDKVVDPHKAQRLKRARNEAKRRSEKRKILKQKQFKGR